jgi:glucose-6-phosphate isomerase
MPPSDPPLLTATRAYLRLVDFARRPHDLAAAGGLTPERIAGMRARACGIDLLYATERVTPEVLAALAELAGETGAVDQFRQMLAGGVMNRIDGFESENRRVLHFATRHLFDDIPDRPGAVLPQDAVEAERRELERVAGFVAGIERGRVANARGEPFTDLVNVGIGGSDIGSRALYLALQPWRCPGRRVHFLSNVDPDDAARVLRLVDPARTLVNVVSKSGGTLETTANQRRLTHAYRSAGLDPARHFVCVTTPGSALDRSAEFREKFHMFDYVGGRFSVTSAAGTVALAFGLGMDVLRDVLRGAREMDLASLELDLRSNLPLLLALLGVWNRNLLGLPTLVILPYSQALSRFPAYVQELDMESNGKSVTRSGQAATWHTAPVVWGEVGTDAQHSFFQQLHQGEAVVPCEFIGFRESQFGEDLAVAGATGQQKLNANLLGQMLALAVGKSDANPNRRFPGNRPSLALIGQRLDPRMLGRLVALYQNKTAFQGFLWGVNSYDQEGVQLGKTLAGSLLPRMVPGSGSAGATDGGLERALLEAAGMLPEASGSKP